MHGSGTKIRNVIASGNGMVWKPTDISDRGIHTKCKVDSKSTDKGLRRKPEGWMMPKRVPLGTMSVLLSY